MQRIAPNTVPPRQSGNPQNSGAQNASPALTMARRIRSEQGAEQARRYLIAMEPYVAPAERAHIAQQLGIQLPAQRPPEAPQPRPPEQPAFSMPDFSNASAPPVGNVNVGGVPNLGGMPNLGSMLGGGGNNLMQMMQLMNAFSGMQGGKGKLDPMMIAQMFSGMMGGK